MRNLSIVVCALLLSVCSGFVSFGKGVDENTAKMIGCNFLMANGISQVQYPSDLVTVYKATAKVKGEIITDYYVFNFSNGTGYVMVSGDDVVEPVLSYSTESAFDINGMAPAAKAWIEGYQNEITYVVENNIPAQEGVAEKWNSYRVPFKGTGAKTTAVTPLITTRWDQGYPYYSHCPGSGSSKAVTGCVATAMAQIMKYWNWPTVGAGYHTYTHPTYGAVSANFGTTAYGWTSMPNTISTTNANVGILNFHCGVAVNMDYSPTESGAYTIQEFSPIVPCAEYALKTYFRYKSTLKGISRTAYPPFSAGYSATVWLNYLKAELNAGRPVIYTGRSTAAGGHAWVCDGFNSSDYMHFNFGWGGASDGYYSINNINPPSLGIGGGGGNFNNMQTIIMGIQPDSSLSTWGGNLKMLSRLSTGTTNSPMQYMSAFSVTAKIHNTNTAAYTGDFCAQVFDVNGTYLGTMQTLTGQNIAAGDSSGTLTFSTTGMYGMIPGTSPHTLASKVFFSAYYGIRIMYRPTGSTTWTPVSNNGTFLNYNQMGVINSNAVELYDSLALAGGSHYINKGSSFSVTTKITPTSGAFSGTVKATLFNIFTGASYDIQVKTGEYIGSSAFKTFTFSTSSVSAPGGTYVLGVQHQHGGSGAFSFTGGDLYQNPVFVTVIGSTDLPVLEADKVDIYPNPANNEVFVDLHGANVNAIHISDIGGREVKVITGVDNQTVVNIPVNDLAPGMYFMQLRSADAVVTKKIVVTE
ncbi:MAG: Peptidase family protein [Flavipsychrobacter sp.]|nr:Peptidase family protein [Flavipsychrobacter sp.]